MLGDIHRKALITAFVAAQERTVDDHLGDLIHSAKMEQHPAFDKAVGQGKLLAVEQNAIVGEVLMYAGEQALGTEGNCDVVLEAL